MKELPDKDYLWEIPDEHLKSHRLDQQKRSTKSLKKSKKKSQKPIINDSKKN